MMVETIFYPFPLADALEIIPSSKDGDLSIHLTTSGIPVFKVAMNLKSHVKVYNLLKEELPATSIRFNHLHKAESIRSRTLCEGSKCSLYNKSTERNRTTKSIERKDGGICIKTGKRLSIFSYQQTMFCYWSRRAIGRISD